MKTKRKIAFFDFCETLANFQTADAYVDYVREQTQSKRMLKLERFRDWGIKIRIFWLIDKLTRGRYSIYKMSKLYQLKGFGRDELEQYAIRYYQEVIRPNFITKMVDILRQKKSEGYEIVLVSGGYDIYLKYFAKEFCVNNVISSRIMFNGNICSGLLWGIDCINENKVILLNKQYKREELVSEAYSDSISDKPFLSWVNTGYVISKNKSQKWAINTKYKEIIW